MKFAPAIILPILCTFFSCENNAQETEYLYRAEAGAHQAQTMAPEARPQLLEMKSVRDSKTGRTICYQPLPTNWLSVTNEYGIQGYNGPDGIQVNSLPSEIYYFNVDPYIAQSSGKLVANPIPLQTIFQQNVAPNIQQQGGRLIKQYPLPKISDHTKRNLQSVLQRSRVQSYELLASEWMQPNGKKILLLISQSIVHSQGGSNWSLGITELEASASAFAQAKETYLFALANTQVDRNTAMAHAADLNRIDREGQQRMAASAAAHQAKMRSNEAAFQATQRAHLDASNTVSDISMQGYWNRSNTQDRMRQSEVNMIREENTMTNPWDNRSMQIQSGYQNYFINAQGDVIGSNNANFNPNVHQNYNHTQWRKMNAGNK